MLIFNFSSVNIIFYLVISKFSLDSIIVVFHNIKVIQKHFNVLKHDL